MKDHDVALLLGQWRNGNRKAVIDALEEEHPGLTATFIVSGVQWPDGALRLTVADCNTISNLLTDRRTELFQRPIEARRRFLTIMGDNLAAFAHEIDENHNPSNFYNSEVAELKGLANQIRDAGR